MAKMYTKKRNFGKSGGRTSKKKTGVRGPKKSGNAYATKVKAMVAGEVQKALSGGLHRERRKATLKLSKIAQTKIMIGGKLRQNNAIRLPITEAIPAMSGAGFPQDVRRRGTNKIVVTGVNVRMSLSVCDETRVMLFAYEPHEALRKYSSAVPVATHPSALLGHVPEQFGTEMVPYSALGVESQHGPLMVRKAGEYVELDSVDGTPFGCRVATHGGKPLGRVFRKSFGRTGLRRTTNFDQSSEDGGSGWTHYTKETINEFFAIKKEYVYAYEGLLDQTFERNAEMFLYIDCPSKQSMDRIDEETELWGAEMDGLIVDIYYHDL